MAAKVVRFSAVLGFACLAAACAGSGGKSSASPGSEGAGTSGSNSGGDGSPDGAGSPGSAGNPGSAGTSSSAAGSGGLPPLAPPRAPAGSCGFDKPAFCDTFDTAHPGGRGGDIDETQWHFARWGHETRQHFVRIPNTTEPLTERTVTSVFCGKPFSGILIPNDVVSCDGVGVDGLTSMQLNEVYDDQGDFAFNSMRIRQLFDFTDRTGTVQFDVDAKINPMNLGHGWWVEFWVTDDPAPMPYHEAPGIVPYPKNGIGINLQGLNNCPQGRESTEVSRVFVTKDHKILHDIPGWELDHDSDDARCFKTQDQKLNRIKIMLTKDRVEIWASDFDDAMNLHRIAVAPILDLPFTRGYVHLQHSAYNARKDGNVTGVQTYRWDNVAFDGPSYAVPRAYEVDDNTLPDIDGTGGHMYGYPLSDQTWTTVKLKGVDLTDAASASFDFSFLANSGRGLMYRFNGGDTHTFIVPPFDREGLRGFSTDVALGDLVSGDNTLDVMMTTTQTDKEEYIGNMELSVTTSK
ncbi:MAG: hypothetical protein WDO69_29280 [Pseudomonadota bacterium]